MGQTAAYCSDCYNEVARSDTPLRQAGCKVPQPSGRVAPRGLDILFGDRLRRPRQRGLVPFCALRVGFDPVRIAARPELVPGEGCQFPGLRVGVPIALPNAMGPTRGDFTISRRTVMDNLGQSNLGRSLACGHRQADLGRCHS